MLKLVQIDKLDQDHTLAAVLAGTLWAAGAAQKATILPIAEDTYVAPNSRLLWDGFSERGVCSCPSCQVKVMEPRWY